MLNRLFMRACHLLRGISNASNCSLASLNDSPPAFRVFRYSSDAMIAVTGVTNTFSNWYKAEPPDIEKLNPICLGE